MSIGLPKAWHKCTLSVAGEFSYASGDHKDGTLSQYVFQVGPRIMWNKPFGRHLQPFLVGLAGFTIEGDYRDKTSFSLAGGFGADIPLVSGRHPWLVLRIQQTWTWIDNNTSDNKYGQTSVAFVYRHEKHEPGPPASSKP